MVTYIHCENVVPVDIVKMLTIVTMYIYVTTFTVIVTLVKHSDDVHWNVRTNI